MSKSEEKSDKSGAAASREVKLSLVTAAVSATLRMIIPVFGLFFIGLIIDALRQTMAFFAIIGAVAGFIVAAFLIYLQIRDLNKRETAKVTTEVREKSSDQKSSKKSSRKPKAEVKK